VFFWAGRLEHVKGIDLLLQAVSMMASKRGDPFTVRLAGRGSLREQLEELASRLGIADLVRFLGRISREEMQREMQEASCFVLPSRYEAFGAVLIEAMATGLPVIATRSGGPGFIVNEANGILIEPEQAEALAGAMTRMTAEYGSFDQDRIRRETLKAYGEDQVMERYHRLFREIIQSQSDTT
jgi:glycosyltransferase involved in cell wall biosynthesis